MEIIGHIVKCKTKQEKERSSKNSTITDNDQAILYYISGYIPKALKKKYMKIKNIEERELKIKCIETMVLKSTSQGVSAKYAKWTSKISRGGLQHPDDNSFLLVKEMENIMRQEVDQENLNANSFLNDKHIETIMSSFMF